MSKILFHPNLNLHEAHRIAAEQGGSLIWSGGRVRLLNAMRLADQAAAAAEAEDYLTALGYWRAACAEIKKNVPEVQPCAD